MTKPQKDDVVTIAFIGKIDNGAVFFTATEEEPMQATIGNSELPPTVENAICDLAVGESVSVRVPPEEGYGQRQKLLLQEIENKEMIQTLNPVPGMIVSLNVDRDGVEEKVPATVISVKDDVITVDYNHPLAGHHLTYEVTLLKISKAQ